ncbi:MAG: flagellar biosynthesis protein FlhF [Candidatus Margulisbacteria bacterium GWF2_35_9]|nr:MAG: flagellar biosynthesis protein FlhF [Candidatus Margulisbacteria bacterium GWF2_35_9]
MRIKKYEASDMQEAIKMIKQDFGQDAIILHSRTIQKGGVLGLFGKEKVEVMAGIDINIVESENRKKAYYPKITKMDTSEKMLRQMPPIVETAYSPKIIEKNQEQSPITTSLEKKLTYLSKEMDDLKETLNLIVKKVANSPHPMISPKLIMYYKALERIGIGEDIIINMLQEVESNFKGHEVEDSKRVIAYIKQKVINLLGSVSPIDLETDRSKRIVALVGPTGVGKTTTIAKMAANFSLIQKKNVALITIDTFRIAAIEQLRNYANIIGIPMEVVFNLDDFSAALRKFKSADLILIDTAGRSPKNNEQILELKKFLKNAFIDTYLVLSVTARSNDIFDTVKRYGVLGGNKVIFTKLDETSSSGVIVDVVKKYSKEISYITNGQNVPDDFEVAYPRRIANIMFSDVLEYTGD